MHELIGPPRYACTRHVRVLPQPCVPMCSQIDKSRTAYFSYKRPEEGEARDTVAMLCLTLGQGSSQSGPTMPERQFVRFSSINSRERHGMVVHVLFLLELAFSTRLRQHLVHREFGSSVQMDQDQEEVGVSSCIMISRVLRVTCTCPIMEDHRRWRYLSMLLEPWDHDQPSRCVIDLRTASFAPRVVGRSRADQVTDSLSLG